MAWASSPVAGFGADLPDAQTQETASDSSDGSTASNTQQQESDGETDQASSSDASQEESENTSSTDSGTEDANSTSSSPEASESEAIGNEDGSSDASSDAGKAAPARAPAADNGDADRADAQSTFTAHWTNAADSEITYTNDDYSASDSGTWTDIACTPNANTLHKSTLNVYLKLAGDSNTTYEAGSVKIYVPAGFYRGLDKDDPLLAACGDSAYQGTALDQIDWMIPKAPDTNDVTDFNYVEETKDVNGQQVKYYVMQNTKALSGTTELKVDIDYRFRPTMLDITSEKQPDGSDMGVYQASYPVSCSINDAEVAKKDLGVSVKTKVNPSKIELTHASLDPNKGVFFSWDSAWGEKPADADQYFYIVWYVNYRRGGASTMPYTYTLSVDSSKTDGGELIGVKKYTPGSNRNENTLQQYEQPEFIFNQMDSSYQGIEGNLDLVGENTSWVGISSAPTKQSAYNTGYIDSKSYNANSNWQNQVYALLFRYPLSKVSDAIDGGTDMVNDGLNIDNGVKVTETWQDGNVVTTDVAPSGDLAVKSLPNGGGSRGLSKARVNTNYRTWSLGAAQSLLSQGNDISLNDYTLHSYNYDDHASWDSESGTYSASTGFEMTDGSYYLYSAKPDYYGKAPGTDSISGSNPVELSDSEYSLMSFYIDDNEYDGTYTNLLGWQRSAGVSTDYSAYKPVEVYTRKRGETGFTKLGEIVRTAKNSYKFTSADGDQTINNVSNWNRVSFPENTAQVKISQESSFYASDVSFHFKVNLHPDTDMINRLKEDIAAGVDSVVGGFASGSQSVNKTSLGSQTVGQYWNFVSYELLPISSNVQFGFNNFSLTNDEKKAERTIPVTLDLYNQTNMRDSNLKSLYGNTETMKDYIPTSGVYYNLLPAGTYVNPDEITVGVRTGPMWSWSQNGCLAPVSNKKIEMIRDYKGTGRTMLKISITVPQGMERYIDYWAGLRVNYILHDTYTNIVDRGGRVTSSAIFVNTTGDTNPDSIFNSNAKDSSYNGNRFSDWEYFQDIAKDAWENGHQVATTQSVLDFGVVTALQSGFTTDVSTEIDPVYQLTGGSVSRR